MIKMIFTNREKEIIETLESKDYATLTDFRRVYRDPNYARLIFKRFTEVLHILSFDVGDRFRINHARIAELLSGNTLTRYQSCRITMNVTPAKLKAYCDLKENQLRQELSTLEADPAVIMGKIEFINTLRIEFQL